MGIQLQFQPIDALKAGYRVSFHAIREIDDSNPQDVSYYWLVQATVYPPAGDSFFMNTDEKMGYLWTDYNDWGSNKKIIAPILARFPIKNIIMG